MWHDALIFKLQKNGIFGKLLLLLKDFLKSRKERVVLNSQHSFWRDVNAGVLQGSILGRLLFLVYINGLSNGLKSNRKLFADDTSLFSVIHYVHSSQIDLNEDLDKINNWAYQWKRSFNPDSSKKAQVVIFSQKVNNVLHPPLTFNNVDVGQIRSQKHLAMFLDFKLSFNEHLETVFTKFNRAITILRKLQTVLPREALLTIHKSFIRPHFDYVDVIYDPRTTIHFMLS